VKDYVLTLLVAAAVTYILTPLVRRIAGRIGAIKQPRDRDVHVVPVPTIGGLAMYAGLAAGLLVADHISVLRGGLANTGMITGLLLAGGLLVVIGFIDDRWGMDALPKAAGQIAAGGILVATGTSLSWLPLPGNGTFAPDTDQQTLLTILVVVATINAVNFIDGLDGLAAGIVGIAAVSFFLYYYELSRVVDISSLAAPALASAILIGICLGFLPHNFSPATIFMGDTGSMLLGLLLAYAPISSIDSLPPADLSGQINRYPVILPLLLPAALLVIPYGDMLLAVVRRTRAGRSPFAPDRKHLHHRLMEIGHSQRASVLIMYLWAAAFSGTVVWLSIQKTTQQGNSNHHGAPIVVFVIITVAAVAVLLVLSIPRLRFWQRIRLTAPADAGTARAGAASAGAAEPAPGSAVLEAPGLAGPGLVGVTAGPAQSRTLSAGDAPGHRGRQAGAPAEPAPRIPPVGTPPLGTPPLAAPPSVTPPPAVPPFATPPSTGLPSTGVRSAWLPSAGLPSTGLPSTGLPSTGLPSTGLPSTGLPPAGRSVIGTPPPAVSGQPPIGRTTHRGAAWRPETSPPAADGNKTEQDGLP
jgi:UDP-GlcNAc:undecaprenyl-phosphate/decaprenyl-phosphate GlcNAc-1-phosphate transferase